MGGLSEVLNIGHVFSLHSEEVAGKFEAVRRQFELVACARWCCSLADGCVDRPNICFFSRGTAKITRVAYFLFWFGIGI